jgi:MFS family permease
VFVQGFAIGRLTARFRETRLIFSAVTLMAFMLLAWAFVPNVPLLLVVLAPLALASGVLNTVVNSTITKSVYHEEVGGALGLSSSLDSLTRVIAPAIGGFLLEQLGSPALGLFGTLILAWVVFYVWQRLLVHPAPPLPSRGEEEMSLEST